jgi:hypothetical protein
MVTNNVWLEPTIITEDYVVNESLMQEYPAIKAVRNINSCAKVFLSQKGMIMKTIAFL